MIRANWIQMYNNHNAQYKKRSISWYYTTIYIADGFMHNHHRAFCIILVSFTSGAKFIYSFWDLEVDKIGYRVTPSRSPFLTLKIILFSRTIIHVAGAILDRFQFVAGLMGFRNQSWIRFWMVISSLPSNVTIKLYSLLNRISLHLSLATTEMLWRL